MALLTYLYRFVKARETTPELSPHTYIYEHVGLHLNIGKLQSTGNFSNKRSTQKYDLPRYFHS